MQYALAVQFSMQYALAAALVDGAVGLSTFDDAMVRRPAIQALLPRIDVRPFAPGSSEAAAGMAGGAGEVRVVVRTQDERLLQEQVRYARGAPENPVSTAEIVAKFRDCVAGRLTDGQVDRAIGQVVGLRDTENLSALLEALVIEPSTAVGAHQ